MRAATFKAIAVAKSEVYAYCVARLHVPRSGSRRAAIDAIAVLDREYRAAPSTPFPGQDRDLVRQVLQRAGQQLQACDPSLARRVALILRV